MRTRLAGITLLIGATVTGAAGSSPVGAHSEAATGPVRPHSGATGPLGAHSEAATGAVGAIGGASTPSPWHAQPSAGGDRGIRGYEGDLWADVVLGQPSFTEVAPYQVVPFKLFNPAGLAADPRAAPGAPPGPGRLYVWDSGNSRVLGLDLARCRAGTPCAAAVVLGQAGPDTGACNGDSGFSTFPVPALAGPDTLCGVPQGAVSVLESKAAIAMTVDHVGTLYVPDFHNHRVLAYEDPMSTDAIADWVWGQGDFAANACNQGGATGPDTLCFKSTFADGAGVALDGEGNLWVADGGNNRVLRFPKGADGRPASRADLVLGQPDLTSSVSGAHPAALSSPASVRVDGTGTVWVADRGNNRVLAFAPPLSSGMSGRPFAHGLSVPLHVEPDPMGAGIWIWDSGNGMYELWDNEGQAVSVVVGKDSFQQDGTCLGALCPGAGSFAFDAGGDLLVSAYGHVQDVIRFGRESIARGAPVEQARLFSPPGGYNFMDSLRSPELGPVTGLAVGADQVVAGDGRRLVWWNGLADLTNGARPAGVLDTSALGSPEAWQGRMAVDQANRLWVSRPGGVLVFRLPLQNESRPVATVLTEAKGVPVLGGGTMYPGRYLHGLAVAGAGHALWVADPAANRVFRVRDPLGAPLVDAILGQVDPSPGTCNRGLALPPKHSGSNVELMDVLCQPGSVALDRPGNLYVSDHTIEAEGNWRVLVFDRGTVPEGNTTPLLAPMADRQFPYRTIQPAAMFEPAFDLTGQMIAGFNAYVVGMDERVGRRVGVYSAPPDPDASPGHLSDVVSLPWSIKVDGRDNVYVADANRHRILVYWRPFGAAGPHRTREVLLPIAVRRR